MIEPVEVYAETFYEVYDPNNWQAIAWFAEEEDAKSYQRRLNEGGSR